MISYATYVSALRQLKEHSLSRKQRLRETDSRRVIHARSVAMRAAWCAKQGPKAWPSKWNVFEIALARGFGILERQLTTALFEDSHATLGVAKP